MSAKRSGPEAPALETEQGRRAWENALEAIGGELPAEVREPLERYARAADLAGLLRAEWEAAGRPATSKGGATGKVLVAHPLVKMIGEAEAEAAKLYEALLRPAAAPATRRGPGRPIGSASAPDRRREPPVIRRRQHHEEQGPELRSVAG